MPGIFLMFISISGGHVRASGAYVKGKTLHEVEKMIIESIKEELI